jgi:glutamate racemase
VNHKFSALLLSLVLVFISISCTDRPTLARQNQAESLFAKDKIRIAVTDSGLGGLSITADLAERLDKSGSFREVDILFYNALFSTEGGYNSLKTREEKLRVFDSALSSLAEDYSPDLIIIGCNTLSVLYPDTEFARTAPVPVAGIVSTGVEQIAEKLKAHPKSLVILFAAQTTIEEGTHKRQLVEKGFLEERIITQACPDLVPYIERGYNSDTTEMLIQAYVDEALSRLPHPHEEILVSFNCTHYGYSEELWRRSFRSQGIEPLAFINPNLKMSGSLFPSQMPFRHKESQLRVRVVSMVELKSEQIRSIGDFLEKISSPTAQALRNYTWEPELFAWEEFVKR